MSVRIGAELIIPNGSAGKWCGVSKNECAREDRDAQGLGSVRRELSESTTLKIDSAGDQLFFKISIQTFPFSEMFI